MTPEQLAQFRDTGCLALPGALERRRLDPVRRHVLDELARLNTRSSTNSKSRVTPFQQIVRLSSAIGRRTLHLELADPDVLSAVHALGGPRLVPSHSQFLVSPPNQGEWTLERLNWHTDVTASGHRCIPGVQAFFLLDDVRPHGGATLAIAGSHRLADQPEPYREFRQALRQQGALAEAMKRHGLSLVEMSGRAGDVYLMDMRVLHTPAFNADRRPRLMATVRYLPPAA